jgi:hypothetical protein
MPIPQVNHGSFLNIFPQVGVWPCGCIAYMYVMHDVPRCLFNELEIIFLQGDRVRKSGSYNK